MPIRETLAVHQGRQAGTELSQHPAQAGEEGVDAWLADFSSNREEALLPDESPGIREEFYRFLCRGATGSS